MLKVYGDTIIPLTVVFVIPFVMVTVHGAVPVSTRVNSASSPLQIVPCPLSCAVGNGCMNRFISSMMVSVQGLLLYALRVNTTLPSSPGAGV